MNNEIIDWFISNAEGNRVFYVPEDIYSALTPEIAQELSEKYGKDHMVNLPQREIFFFEWLKNEDYDVWADLWDNQMDEPYLVGMSFLPALVDKSAGFLICDLVANDNYYFTPAHIVEKESSFLLDSIKTRFLNKQSLTPAQLLLLQISYGPLDIWHFAYKSKISLSNAKNAVQILVDDNVLVHLKDAEHLSIFIS